MSVRIAIIGAGIMGADHARILSEDVPGAVLQVVCDASPERARQVAEACGALHVTTDPMDAIARRDVDAVLIASPDDTHAALSLAAIAAGKPALCEKPLSQAAAECRAVIDAELRAGHRMVQVGFMRRFDPSYRAMRAARRDETIGRAILMHNFHRNVQAPRGFTGQMAITNSAPHEFDIARYVLGADYAAISAFQPSAVDPTRAGAPVFMVLETDQGQLVNIEINNNAAYGYDVRGELVGETGSVFLAAPVHARYNASLAAVERYPPDWRSRFEEAYRLQNKAFLNFVQTGGLAEGAADAWDGYRATVVAEAGVRALSGKRRIEIAPEPAPALYSR